MTKTNPNTNSLSNTNSSSGQPGETKKETMMNLGNLTIQLPTVDLLESHKETLSDGTVRIDLSAIPEVVRLWKACEEYEKGLSRAFDSEAYWLSLGNYPIRIQGQRMWEIVIKPFSPQNKAEELLVKYGESRWDEGWGLYNNSSDSDKFAVLTETRDLHWEDSLPAEAEKLGGELVKHDEDRRDWRWVFPDGSTFVVMNENNCFVIPRE